MKRFFASLAIGVFLAFGSFLISASFLGVEISAVECAFARPDDHCNQNQTTGWYCGICVIPECNYLSQDASSSFTDTCSPYCGP